MTCVAWCVHFPEVLSPPCLPLSPFLFLCVGWCVHLPDVLSPLSPLSPSLSSFLSPSLSPNLSFFLFPFVVGGLILHFFKQCTVGVGFLKVSALVLDGVSAFPRSCLLYCLPVCLSSCFPVAGGLILHFFPNSVRLGVLNAFSCHVFDPVPQHVLNPPTIWGLRWCISFLRTGVLFHHDLLVPPGSGWGSGACLPSSLFLL